MGMELEGGLATRWTKVSSSFFAESVFEFSFFHSGLGNVSADAFLIPSFTILLWAVMCLVAANNATSPQLYENKWTEQDFCYKFPLNEHLTLTFEALKAFVNVCLAVNQKFFVALSNAVWDLMFVLMYEGRIV